MSTRNAEGGEGAWVEASRLDRGSFLVGTPPERRAITTDDVTLSDGSSSDRGPLDGRGAVDLRNLARHVVRAALHDEMWGRRASNDDVRQVLRQACHIARARGTHVERVLILLKEAWQELPEARPRRHSDAQEALSRVITLCIEEYYAPLHPA